MNQYGGPSSSWRNGSIAEDLSGLRSEGREPGARRRKIAGYLRAANEIRQNYQQSYSAGWRGRGDGIEESFDGAPGSFPEGSTTRSGDEIVLFPSYARRHVKTKPRSKPSAGHATRSEYPGAENYGNAEAEEHWKQQWEKYENDHAIVDVDVRGWIFSPFKGPMTRKQRIFVGLARQMVGIPSATTTSVNDNESGSSSRNTSPPAGSHRDRLQARVDRHDEELVTKEAESLLRRGEAEAAAAGKGQYSENPRSDRDDASIRSSRGASPAGDSRRGSRIHQLNQKASASSLRSNDSVDSTTVQKRYSWSQPATMNQTELVEANNHLMARLKPFMANPLASTAISIFYFNDTKSQQRTVYTNPSGHFSVRTELEFVPTHVRILASENLSATEEVIVTESKGVSLISDIDDTIKHSAISSGAREIFRNAFIRDLADLTIDGVKEWYAKLADRGVKFHYVSNSPWQLYPVLTKFFAMAGLPPGSFHLKQYSGMLQGIFEPVAERKKGTLDKIAMDFPDRQFILVGDSGEADLEVYTDFVLENPGRVLGVFIRDVTTPARRNFFDPSMDPASDPNGRNSAANQGNRTGSQNSAALASFDEEDDPELKAAIAASLRDMEDEQRDISSQPRHHDDAPETRPKLPPRKPTKPRMPTEDPSSQSDLIDFSEDSQRKSNARHDISVGTLLSHRSPPIPPNKPSTPKPSTTVPTAVRNHSYQSSPRSPPPPKPQRSSSAISVRPSPASTNKPPKPAPPPKPSLPNSQPGYAAAARAKLSSAYNNLPAMSSLSSYAPYPSRPNAAPNGNATAPSTNTNPSTYYPSAAANFATSRTTPTTTQQTQPFSSSASQSSDPNYTSSNNNGTILNKREELWLRRWDRAVHILAEKGVVLKSWRVGHDAMPDAVRLVDKANRQVDTNNDKRKSGGEGEREPGWR